jgi:hypothetical protein
MAMGSLLRIYFSPQTVINHEIFADLLPPEPAWNLTNGCV